MRPIKAMLAESIPKDKLFLVLDLKDGYLTYLLTLNLENLFVLRWGI